MSKLLHLKASRTRILSTFPNRNFGKDGDIVISNISGKGTYICIKSNGVWYTANRLSELSKIDKIPLNILAKKLRIKDIKSSSGTDKFVVSEGDGELKYRTGEEVLDDLGTDKLSINYKTAYCSLGQYGDKETCESNGGTWYYSENDSHDSISNTAENELLTVGSSIGKIDAESTLIYDGSTLHIKRNTDFDDNWQTITQDILLKLSYDSSNQTSMSVNSSGVFLIAPTGLETSLKNSTLKIGTIAEVGSDTDKILMSDSGTVKYVTGANLRSYIGAGTSSFGGALNDLSDVTYSSGDLTISSLDKIISGDLSFESSGKILIDKNSTATTTSTNTAMQIDFDQTGISASGQTITNKGLDIDMNCESVTHVGGMVQTGIDIDLVAATDGNQYNVGMDINVSGSDGNKGLNITTDGTHIKLVATADANDYATIALADTGDLTIATVGSGTTDSDLTLDVDGDIILEADGHVEFDNCAVGFDRLEATFSATTVIGSGGTDDTDIDFRLSNKYRLEMSNDIAQMNLIFPNTSGNFVLVCHILGGGGGNHDVTAWKVWESDESAATTTDVMWAGGSVPAFTSGAATDIVSFYWDADEQQCYGIASLAFATP